jgi:hypothetical protein
MVIVRTFGDAIVSQELNKEAWKKLSREFKWNEELLRKYRSEIDWKELSENTEMLWTASIIESFKDYIDWKTLSICANEKLLTAKIIEQFADRWDWHELSDNNSLKLSYALLDKFADKWDWKRIINRWLGEELYTPDFLERYKEYIPVEHFQGSCLWNELVEKRFDELVEEIMG